MGSLPPQVSLPTCNGILTLRTLLWLPGQGFLTGTIRLYPHQLATGRLEVPKSVRSRIGCCHLLTVQPLAKDSVPGCRFLLPLHTPSLELAASFELSHGVPVGIGETHSTPTLNLAFQVHRARVLRVTPPAWKVLPLSCTESQRENNNQVWFLPSCHLSRGCEGPLICKTDKTRKQVCVPLLPAIERVTPLSLSRVSPCLGQVKETCDHSVEVWSPAELDSRR